MTNFRLFVTTLLAIGFFTTACTDTDRAKFTALGKPGEITCYSGGKEIYHGFSTGKVLNAHKSDGYEFEEVGSNKLIRITADCIVKN